MLEDAGERRHYAYRKIGESCVQTHRDEHLDDVIKRTARYSASSRKVFNDSSDRKDIHGLGARAHVEFDFVSQAIGPPAEGDPPSNTKSRDTYRPLNRSYTYIYTFVKTF